MNELKVECLRLKVECLRLKVNFEAKIYINENNKI